MQRSRRKKTLRFLVFFTILLFIAGYIFRYPLILQLQYLRFRSLNENALRRIWVHRVNSIERYDLLRDKFEGFETDVSFNEKTGGLYVRHQSNSEDTFTLDSFFRHANNKDKRFWIDMRLGSLSNKYKALEALSVLDKQYNIRNTCIIELYSPDAAALFAGKGYIVSLNLSAELQDQLFTNPAIKDSVDRQLSNVKYISREARYLAPVRKLFPEKRIITWHVLFKDFLDREPVRDLLNDPQVDIILVNIKTQFYR